MAPFVASLIPFSWTGTHFSDASLDDLAEAARAAARSSAALDTPSFEFKKGKSDWLPTSQELTASGREAASATPLATSPFARSDPQEAINLVASDGGNTVSKIDWLDIIDYLSLASDRPDSC